MRFSLRLAASTLLVCASVRAQTSTLCNPLTTTCPPDTALGKSISVDFTKGAVDSFAASGSPSYGSDGVSFTVTKSGDAPQLTSLFYIMFGKVSVTMKAAPGAGIVSSVVLQSDNLDEIDWEWLGADSGQVQTNYFGKGDVTTYNRGAYSPAANNQAEFITYTIEWTSTQIIWSVGGTVVRVLTPATADTNQYPQTPMQVKLGAWSGGDPSNPSGTISWARGPTDYTKGPFTMQVRSISVADYSTGTAYTYSDMSGAWTSIKSTGGKINGAAPAAGSIATAQAPSATSASPSIPAGIGSDTRTKTGWPWVQTAVATSTPSYSSIAGIPSGWTVSGNGKIVPASAAATTTSPTYFSSAVPSPSSSGAPYSGNGSEALNLTATHIFVTTSSSVPTSVPSTYTTTSITTSGLPTTLLPSDGLTSQLTSSSGPSTITRAPSTTLAASSVAAAALAPATSTADAQSRQAVSLIFMCIIGSVVVCC